MLKILVITTVILFVGIGTAFALDTDYYTYGGFDAVFSAWSLVSMVFVNSSYKLLFFTLAAIGLFLGGAFTYFSMLSGGKAGFPLAWFFHVLLGVILYLALFVPKGTIIISDPVLNRYQPVTDIPNGITMTVKFLNTIERGMVDIITTSGTPLDYKTSAGGLGFSTLLKATSETVIPDKYVAQSLNKYISDCVLFEINRPGTSLMVSNIMSSTGGALLSQMGMANNPGVLTTYYSAAYQAGSSMTCEQSWDGISAYFSDTNNLNNMLQARCTSAGFNPSTEITQCKQLIATAINTVTNDPIAAETFIQQVALSGQLNSVIQQGGIDNAIAATSNINTVSSTYAMGIGATEYLPILRAIVTSVAVGLLPFLILFVPTPIGGKMIGLGAGFFIWLTAWGITDALTHQLATDYATTYFDAIRGTGTGYASIMAIPSASTKALGLFGMIRFSGMLLASIISAVIIPIGAHAMHQFAGHFAGPVQSAAGSAGTSTATPGGFANTLAGYQGSVATMTATQKFGFDGMVTAKTYDTFKQTQGSLSERGDVSKRIQPEQEAGIFAGEMSSLKNSTAMFTTQGSLDKQGGRDPHIDRTAELQSSKNTAHVSMSEADAGALGFTQTEMFQFHEGNNRLTDTMADKVNALRGTKYQAGDRLSYDRSADGSISNVSATRILRPEDLSKMGDNGVFRDEKGRGYSFAGGASMEMREGGYSTVSGNIRDHNGQKGHNLHEGHLTLNGDTVTNAQGTGGYSFDHVESQQSIKRDNNLSENRHESLSSHKDTVQGPRKIADSSGRTYNVFGEWQYGSVKDASGKTHRELISGTFQSGQSGEFLKFDKQSDGSLSFGVAKGTLDTKGKWVTGNFSSITQKQFEGKGGYSVTQFTGSDGGVVYEQSSRGQDVNDVHRLRQDYSKTQNKNLTSGLFSAGQDLKEVSDGQQIALTVSNAAEQTAGIVGKVKTLFSAPFSMSKGPSMQPPLPPTPTGPYSQWPPRFNPKPEDIKIK